MGYVVAAYAITLATIGLYWLRLVRERRRLQSELGE